MATTKGKITILGGGGLLGVLSLCFLCTLCSIVGSLNDSQQVAKNQPTELSKENTLPTAMPASAEPTQPTESTATPIPTIPPEPMETPILTTASEPTFTPEPMFTSDPCTIEVKQEGRSEPEYVGLQGYVIESYPGDYYDALPSCPWGVPLLEQVGPDLWKEGSETLPHKTSVIVLEQHLKRESFGRYSGFLVVKSLEDSSEYRVDHHNFAPTVYWNCPAH